MEPGKYNIPCYRGVTLRKEFLWSIDGAPVDTALYDFELVARRLENSSGDPVVLLNTANGGIIRVVGTPGAIQVYMSAVDTNELVAVGYLYNLRVTRLLDSEVFVLLAGAFTVNHMIAS